MARTVSVYGLSADIRASIEEAGLQLSEDSYPPLRCSTMVLSAALPLAPAAPLTILIAERRAGEECEVGGVGTKPYFYIPGHTDEDIQLPLVGLNEKLEGYLPLFSAVVSFDPEAEVIPLIADQNGRLIAFCYLSGSNRVIVVPPLSDKAQYGQLIQLLLKNADRLFTGPETYSSDKEKWKRLNEKLDTARERLEKSVSDTKLEIEKAFPESVFLTGLTSPSEELFSKAVGSFLSYLGLEADGDYVIIEDKRLLLSTVVTTGAVSSITQFSKQLAKERKGESAEHGLLCANAFRFLPAERKLAAYSHLLTDQAQQSEITLISAADLLKLYENIESGIISRSWAVSQLLVSGYSSFHIPEANYISTISRIGANDPSLCRFILDNTPIRKGMKVIIEAADGHLRRDTIVSLTAGKVAMAEASDGEVTVRFTAPVLKGEKLFLGL